MIRFALAGTIGAVLWLPAVTPAAPATPLVATVGPGLTITLTKGGRKVTTLRAGAYRITVRDRSRSHNFVLRGPGVRRSTTVSFVGTKTWTVRLRRGQHTYICTPHAFHMKGAFRVR